jgi:hypothetical protein
MAILKTIDVSIIVGTNREKVARDLEKADDESVYEFKKRVCAVIDEALTRAGVK